MNELAPVDLLLARYGEMDKRRLWIGLSLLFLALVLAGCAESGSPAESAQAWLTAVSGSEGATALNLTCLDLRQINRAEDLLGGRLGDFFRLVREVGALPEVDVSGITFEVVEQQGDTAVIQVSGPTRLAALGQETTIQLDERWTMIREDGQWKWCGR